MHPKNRLYAKCYADRHETTNLRAPALGRRARGFGGEPALVRRRFVLRRCQILLASSRGENAYQIARSLGCDSQTHRAPP